MTETSPSILEKEIAELEQFEHRVILATGKYLGESIGVCCFVAGLGVIKISLKRPINCWNHIIFKIH